MAKISVRYFTVRRRHDGGERYFWQPNKALKNAGWKLTRLPSNKNEALSHAELINNQVDEWRAGRLNEPTTKITGSVGAVILSYKKSRHFTKLSKGTRRDYDSAMRVIDEWAGDMPAAMINAKMVQDLYDARRPKGHRTADYVIQVLRIIFNHAERENIIPKGSNPASKPRLDYRATKGKLWERKSVLAFVAAADEENMFSVGTAVLINEWMGQRKGDIIVMKETQYEQGVIKIKQSKTGAEVELDLNLAPYVKARIEEQLRRNAGRANSCGRIIQQEDGKAFGQYVFTNCMARIRDKAIDKNPEFAGLIFKDLRHTAVTRLAEAGCTIPEIASITGHSFKTVEVILDRYNVRTKKMASNALSKRADAEAK